MDFSWLSSIFLKLPLPWIITGLEAIGLGWVIYKLWLRNNDLQDRMLKMSEDQNDKYNTVIAKVNDTMNALITVFGGKK
jgi:hypothetical protein